MRRKKTILETHAKIIRFNITNVRQARRLIAAFLEEREVRTIISMSGRKCRAFGYIIATKKTMAVPWEFDLFRSGPLVALPKKRKR